MNLPRPLALAAILLIATRLFMWAQPLALEDAYITFRYARSFAEGHGLVYNLGERVMGYTSLPWALWCSLGIALHVDPVWWARASCLAADLVTLWLAWRMLPSDTALILRDPKRAALGRYAFIFFFAGWPLFAAASASGLEMPVFVMLTFLAARLAWLGSPWAGWALGALAIFRPEGLVAAGIISIGATWRARIEAISLVTLAGLGLTLYYGSPIPQSLLAKAAVYGTPGPLAGRHWWDWALPFALGKMPVAFEGQLVVHLALFAGAAVVGARHLWTERSAARLVVAAGLGVWGCYALAGVAYFWWYTALPLATWGLLVAGGLPHVTRGRALPVAGLLAILGSWSAAGRIYQARANVEALSFGPAAEVLLLRGSPAESVLLEPIGWIGWRSGLRVVDEVGLVSPDVARRRVRGETGWYADVVRSTEPDWIVTRRTVLENGEAFAGAGRPWRSAEEKERVLSQYAVAWPAPGEKAEMVVMRRVR